MHRCSTMRFSSLFFSFALLIALVLGGCSSGEKDSSTDGKEGTPQYSWIGSGSADTTGSRSTTSASGEIVMWTSNGAATTVAEGTTYTPPPPRSKEPVNIDATSYDLNVQGDVTITGVLALESLAPDATIVTDASGGLLTIASNGVTTDKIAYSQVLNQDLAVGSVDNRVIQNESIDVLSGNGDFVDDRVILLDGIGVNGAFYNKDVPNLTGDVWQALTVDGSGLAIRWDSIAKNNDQENNNEVAEIIPEVQQIPEPEPLYENGFRVTSGSPYSTFSIDVDNASYSNLRGALSRGTLPPPDAVRIEEMVNYFNYNYPEPNGAHPFAFHSEVLDCPWNSDHLIVKLALQGKRIQAEQAAAANLVFLIDVSGSMSDKDKLPLLKKAFSRFVDELRPQDHVAIVVYAGAAGLVLPSTPGSDKKTIKDALDKLQSGGSTAGGAGIQLAYNVARDNFLPNGINRVILATDGDFNVGVSSDDGLVKLIEEKRKDGVFLSVLGFGTGNYQDTKMEKLADNGNGNYYYIDKLKEGERVLVEEMSGTLYAIAKDVKLQIKFNPAKVSAYRLIGYENRVLAAKDFDNDAKDAGELGAGHTVTAMYEVVPVGSEIGYAPDTTKGEEYQMEEGRPELLSSHDLLLARLRYKAPSDSVSKLIEHLVKDESRSWESGSEGSRFALSVAEFGMVLRGSSYKGSGSYEEVLKIAQSSVGSDADGYRKEFIELVQKAKAIAERKETVGSR